MRSELSTLWKTDSEEDIPPDTVIHTDETFTPDLWVANTQACCLSGFALGFLSGFILLNLEKLTLKLALLCLYSSRYSNYASVLMPLFSVRNIFQDVAHRDTLVKSFIDEVSFHIIHVSIVFLDFKAENRAV